MSKSKTKRSPILIAIIILLLLVMVYSGFRVLDSVFSPDSGDSGTTSTLKTITHDGGEYFPRQDITVFMLMGIDRTGPVTASEYYNNTGSADMVALAVFDETEQTYTVLLLNRDTLMEVPVLGIGGKQAGTAYEQLALAHTYGSGMEDSCENTKTAVSNFLNGISIDYYLSMNMDAIAILNDAVGGVSVTVTEDFSAVNPTIPMGETVLNGQQAFDFVQNRKDVGNQMNISRMERHKEYMRGFMRAMDVKLEESDSFVVKTYESLSPYIVSDCSVNMLSTLISRYSDYTLKEILSPQGENVKGETYMEFHVDESALNELVLRLFYSKK